MLLLSSFQAFSFINDDPFLRLFYITTGDVSTPENTDKVIELATNKGDYADITDYTITGDAYANWHMFTLRGNKLTFKATAFKAGSNTYRIKIKAVTWMVIPKHPIGFVSPDPVKFATEKTLTVTVTKNPDDDEALRITTADVSTPENTDKVITLITNKSDTNLFKNMITTFDIVGGADAERFTLKKGNKLTFKATAFKARNNTYRVNIRVLQRRFDRGFEGNLPETAYKTLTVTVTKNPDDDGALRITTAADVSTPENTDKVITLITNKSDTNVFKNMLTIFTIVDGADAKRFTLKKGNKLTFKATAFKAQSNTYRVKIKVFQERFDRGFSPWAFPPSETAYKTLTVTVTKTNTGGNPDDDGEFYITTADISFVPENTDKLIWLTTNNIGNAYFTIIDGADTDASKFSVAGNALVFKATAFAARSDATYRVKIKAITLTFDSPARRIETEKILAVTVLKGLYIITTNVSTPENTDKVIWLTTNKSGVNFTMIEGADANKFTLAGNELTFKGTAFEARSDATYRVKIKATRGNETTNRDDETTEKTLTVTVINPNTGDNPDNDGALRITTADVSTPENTDKVMTLITNKSDTNLFKNMITTFDIVGGADAERFTLKKGNKLTFKATAFKARNNTYRVNIRVLQKRFDRGFESNPPETAYKTLVVTVTEVIEKKGNIEELIMEDDNAKVTAQAVRKESKSASKLLLSKVGKTLMGRLSHIRHKNKQKSSFSANGFVNGIQVSFADSQTNSFINRVLSANGLSNVIPISSRKVERWDTWTNAKVVIGKSNGAGANKTEFNLKSLNIGMDRRIAQDKIIGFAIDRTATGSDFSGEVDTTQYTLSSYGALELSDKGSIEAVLGVAKATHDISNSADQDNSNGFFASIAYRADLQAQSVDLSPFIRYDISRIKMKANDILTSSETTTDEAIALGIDISKTGNYEEGQLTRFVSLEYKSDLRRDGNDYLSKNAEQEVIMKLGLDYQKDDTTTSVSYERIQSTNNKAHSYGIEGTVRWKF